VPADETPERSDAAVSAKPTEAEVAALLASADAVRKRPSRGLWIFALAVSVVCLIGLGYGLLTYWDTEPDQAAVKSRETTSTGGTGFGVGLIIGLAAGIAIGSGLALRRRPS
jgi:hypothetical protein